MGCRCVTKEFDEGQERTCFCDGLRYSEYCNWNLKCVTCTREECGDGQPVLCEKDVVYANKPLSECYISYQAERYGYTEPGLEAGCRRTTIDKESKDPECSEELVSSYWASAWETWDRNAKGCRCSDKDGCNWMVNQLIPLLTQKLRPTLPPTPPPGLKCYFGKPCSGEGCEFEETTKECE